MESDYSKEVSYAEKLKKKSLIKGTLNPLVGLLWWVVNQAAPSLPLSNGGGVENSVKIPWVELRTEGSLTSCHQGKTDSN